MEQVTIKGRVGEFEYGYIGSQKWIVRDRSTGEIVGRERNQLDAANTAKRIHAWRGKQ